MSSIKKNLGYQTVYQVLNVGLPLITAPFLARVLGAESLGIMSYTSSIVHYFSLFAMMGLTNYGTRSIAVVKDNKQVRDDVFSQIFYLQLITTGFCLIGYTVYLLFLCKDNILISCIQSMAVLACFFDINWFYFGIEEFKFTVVRNTIIRILSVALILIFVRNPGDLWIYAILLIGSQLISQLVLWIYVPKYVSFKKPNIHAIINHFVPNIKLFMPLLAMSVYHIMDKTMLGVFSTYTQSGYYYNADKVVNIPIGLLTGVGTVMLPRMSALAGENKKNELDSMFNTSIRVIGFVSSAMCCGIAAISKEFTPLFFGPGYDSCVILIIVLAPVLFIKGYSLIFRNLYMIPNKLEDKLTASVVAGAVVNLIANLMLIPHMGALGAVIGTLVAEAVSCIWQYISIVGQVKCMKSVATGLGYFLIGIIMYLGVRFVADYIVVSMVFKLVVEVFIGVVFYSVLCVIFWLVTRNSTAIKIIKSILNRR